MSANNQPKLKLHIHVLLNILKKHIRTSFAHERQMLGNCPVTVTGMAYANFKVCHVSLRNSILISHNKTMTNILQQLQIFLLFLKVLYAFRSSTGDFMCAYTVSYIKFQLLEECTQAFYCIIITLKNTVPGVLLSSGDFKAFSVCVFFLQTLQHSFLNRLPYNRCNAI